MDKHTAVIVAYFGGDPSKLTNDDDLEAFACKIALEAESLEELWVQRLLIQTGLHLYSREEIQEIYNEYYSF